MPPALTPALALAYVRELSADVRAAVVLDGAGALLAGPAELAAPARALLAAAGGAAELDVVGAGGVVCAVRWGEHAAVAVCGRFALPGVARQDLRTALAAAAGQGEASGPAVAASEAGRMAAAGARGPSDPVGAPARSVAAGARVPADGAAGSSDMALERAAEALISALQRGSGA